MSGKCSIIPTEAYLPRFRALALFGRRPPQRVIRSSFPASENVHKAQNRTPALPQISPDHSSSVSARSKNASGIVRFIAFAVFRLMANSNVVGCSMGKSFGC
jgi:hypothetical protein